MTTTSYHRTFVKVIFSGFGLWGSTKRCVKETIVTTKWDYEYNGKPLLPKLIGLFGPGTTNGGGGNAQTTGVFRWLSAESACSGDPLVPNMTAQTEQLVFIGLDGTVLELPFTDRTGTIASFLGNSFDPAGFDSQYIASSSWTGAEASIPSALFLEPTLTLSTGSQPGVPVSAILDLSAQDTKALSFDLGQTSANCPFIVLVSATDQDNGSLGVLDGVQLPIVLDATTTAFEAQYPELIGVSDASGQGTVNFPTLPDDTYNGVDLNLAVVTMDPATGLAKQASTYVRIAVRDLSECGQ